MNLLLYIYLQIYQFIPFYKSMNVYLSLNLWIYTFQLSYEFLSFYLSLNLFIYLSSYLKYNNKGYPYSFPISVWRNRRNQFLKEILILFFNNNDNFKFISSIENDQLRLQKGCISHFWLLEKLKLIFLYKINIYDFFNIFKNQEI